MRVDLSGQVAVVTGSSRGIGRAVAVELALCGARVVVNYNRNADAAGDVVDAIRTAGGEAVAIQADVSDQAASQELMKKAVSSLGGLDILVNNAGTTRDMLLMRMSESDWDTVLSINLKSAFNCIKSAGRVMMKERYGRIINMTSVAGLAGNVGQANYCAAKAGLIGLTKAAAKELAPRDITVNAVAPGYIATDLTDVLSDDIKQGILSATPLGRFGGPDDVAHAVVFLASREAGFITGQILSVDGGLVMQ